MVWKWQKGFQQSFYNQYNNLFTNWGTASYLEAGGGNEAFIDTRVMEYGFKRKAESPLTKSLRKYKIFPGFNSTQREENLN